MEVFLVAALLALFVEETGTIDASVVKQEYNSVSSVIRMRSLDGLLLFNIRLIDILGGAVELVVADSLDIK